MVSLGVVPFLGLRNHGCDGLARVPLLLDLFGDARGDLLLLWRMVKDATAVLRARIHALAIKSRGIVHAVKELEQCCIGHLFWIENHLQRFGV